MKHIEALIADGGSISLGALDAFECVAAAAEASNTLAMLVRRGGETLSALLKRLDKAIKLAYEDGEYVDEVNAAEG